MQLSLEMIETRIVELATSPENSRKLSEGMAFGPPIIGYAVGTDPLFQVSKHDNGEPGMNPMEWLEAKYGQSYDPAKIGVISIALPIALPIVEKMRKEKFHPCLEWLLNRTNGTEFIRKMAVQLEAFFEQHGVDAIAPIADERMTRLRSERGLSSNWSEPMAAYLCGLGLLRSPTQILTPLGACVQLGSIIVAMKLPAAERANASCAQGCSRMGECRDCIDRCPIGAISERGVNQTLCLKYQTQYIMPYFKHRFGFDGMYGCGLCMTGVRCELEHPDLPLQSKQTSAERTKLGDSGVDKQ